MGYFSSVVTARQRLTTNKLWYTYNDYVENGVREKVIFLCLYRNVFIIFFLFYYFFLDLHRYLTNSKTFDIVPRRVILIVMQLIKYVLTFPWVILIQIFHKLCSFTIPSFAFQNEIIDSSTNFTSVIAAIFSVNRDPIPREIRFVSYHVPLGQYLSRES